MLYGPAAGAGAVGAAGARLMETGPEGETKLHTCHNLPPSEIDEGLFLAGFTGSEGK